MELSRLINHKLNEFLAKGQTKGLSQTSALEYARYLKMNILGQEKQEKVNSIVVLAKLIDYILYLSECVLQKYAEVLDSRLFDTLFAVVSSKMSTETYKAILKLATMVMCAAPYPAVNHTVDVFLPVYGAMCKHLDAVDVISSKLYLPDQKIVYNSIRLFTEIVNRALEFNYDNVIIIVGRLKHVKFFPSVASLKATADLTLLEGIASLETAFLRLNDMLHEGRFDLTKELNRILLNNLFLFLDVSLNEYGAPALVEEYVKAGFTLNPRGFIAQNANFLSAMDLKVFLKDPNISFKKRFHEDLMMSDTNKTFPLFEFMKHVTEAWYEVFKRGYLKLGKHILSWDLFIYYSMSNCLVLWQDVKAQLEDFPGIVNLLQANIKSLEKELAKNDFEDALERFSQRKAAEIRRTQFNEHKGQEERKWSAEMEAFDATLTSEVVSFVREQRVIQLIKGLWVHTEGHAETLFGQRARNNGLNYLFLALSPNRRRLHYKGYAEKSVKPTVDDMNEFVELKDVVGIKSIKIGKLVGEEDKARNKMLISVKGTIAYEKIMLVGKTRTLLSFYTDSEVNKLVWLDGLKMLKGEGFGPLSTETLDQLLTLAEIRRNSQLLTLEKFHPLPGEEEYTLSELEAVASGFAYT